VTLGRSAARWALTLSLLAPGCASFPVRPAPGREPIFDAAAEAQRIDTEAEREEVTITQKTVLYDDPLLEEYVARIGTRVESPAARAAGRRVRFTIVRDPALNAFAMPDGHVYVHTGLLAQIESEPQLAMILARELAHVTGDHALRWSMASSGDWSEVSAILDLPHDGRVSSTPSAIAVIGPMASAILGGRLEIAALASMSGYGEALEREADARGIDALVDAGYDPSDGAHVFAVLETAATDPGPLERFLLGRRESLVQRLDSIRRLLSARHQPSRAAAGSASDPGEFARRMQTLVRDNAELDIRAGRFPLAQRQLDRVLTASPRDPVAHLYQGALHRLAAQRAVGAEDRAERLGKALACYERSAALDPEYAEPYRELGLLYFQEGDETRARAAFARYLELAPEASDAQRIREYITDLGG
jgi:beta-barrel assembly-enhancing protease